MAPKKKADQNTSAQMSLELVHYDGASELGKVDLGLDPIHDTMWASTEQMAQLFAQYDH